MITETKSKKKSLTILILAGVLIFICVACGVLSLISASTPEAKATATAQMLTRTAEKSQALTSTAEVSTSAEVVQEIPITTEVSKSATVSPPTFTPTPTSVPVIDVSECRLNAAFVEDVTVSDNAKFTTGEQFVKTWKIKNVGTCGWGTGYTLNFVNGDRLGTVDSVNIPDTPPGETVEVSVTMQAPSESGRYRSEWQMCVNQDNCFGVKLFTQIVILPPATPTPTKTLILTPTPTPNTAGVTEWLVYKNQQVGVKEVAWDYRLGYYRPASGKIYVSLYIMAVNIGQYEERFSASNFALVDGGGEISGKLIWDAKEPGFGTCTVKPGGVCEGWWTTSIWDREEVKQNLLFRWSPGLFGPTQETEINLK